MINLKFDVMGNFAKIDENGIVTNIIVASKDYMKYGSLADEKGWVEITEGTNAGKGYSYDAKKGTFLAPKPFESWVLDKKSNTWTAPVAKPQDGERYRWNESEKGWKKMEARTV